MIQNKDFTSNDNQSKYVNKKPYNNVPPAADEELAPILMTKEMFKDKTILRDNVETWNIHGHRIPVAFAPIKAGTLDGWMKFFNSQVRVYIATGGTDDFLKENGHEDDLSFDKFTDDAESDEDNSGFEPAQTESFEDTVILGMVMKDLVRNYRRLIPSTAGSLNCSMQALPKKKSCRRWIWVKARAIQTSRMFRQRQRISTTETKL